MSKNDSCEFLNAQNFIKRSEWCELSARVLMQWREEEKQNFSKETDSGELFQCSDFHNKARMWRVISEH